MTEEAKGLALPQVSASLARLVEGVSKSVVEIRSGKRALASGFVWRPELVVTADEALGDYESATVALDGHTFEAAVVGRDPSTDVAVLAGERAWCACPASRGRLCAQNGRDRTGRGSPRWKHLGAPWHRLHDGWPLG